MICLYVDDMLMFDTNVHVVNKTNKLLSSHFEMKDMAEIDVISGIKIRKTNDGLFLCQSHYIKKMLKKFNSSDVTPMRTPYNPSIHLKKNKGFSILQTNYMRKV